MALQGAWRWQAHTSGRDAGGPSSTSSQGDRLGPRRHIHRHVGIHVDDGVRDLCSTHAQQQERASGVNLRVEGSSCLATELVHG